MKSLSLKSGFTLVELIAVVAVIAILVGIVVPRIGDLRARAKASKMAANVEIVQGAYERAKMDFNDATATTYNGYQASDAGTCVSQLLADGYLNKLPEGTWSATGTASKLLFSVN